MSDIKLAPNLVLDKSVARKVFSFVAMREAGKTWATSVFAEQLILAGIPIVVIDPMGVFWGLKFSADLEGPGLGVVVFGGEHADLPLVPENAAKIADAIMLSNISAVFDTSELSEAEAKRFVTAFADELRHKNVDDRMIFLEEADIYAPQQPQRDENIVLHAIKQLVMKGGNRNLGITMLTQRPAILNKNVLTQSDYLVVMRTNAPQDKEAVKAWAQKRTAKKEEVNAWLDSLSDLPNGEGYVWGPMNSLPGLHVKFNPRITFHATRENLKILAKKKPKPMDVGYFLEQYQHAFDPTDKSLISAPKRIAPPKQKKPVMKYYPNFPAERMESVGTQKVLDAPRVASPAESGFESPSVHQALPNILIEQWKPTLGLSVEMLNQPTTMIGKLAVLLNEWTGNITDVSQKKLRENLAAHGWEDDGLVVAIDQFLRWEILWKNRRGVMTLDKSRIRVIERTEMIPVR